MLRVRNGNRKSQKLVHLLKTAENIKGVVGPLIYVESIFYQRLIILPSYKPVVFIYLCNLSPLRLLFIVLRQPFESSAIIVDVNNYVLLSCYRSVQYIVITENISD